MHGGLADPRLLLGARAELGVARLLDPFQEPAPLLLETFGEQATVSWMKA